MTNRNARREAGCASRSGVGTVRSAANCAPLAGARVEVWLTNPAGQYDDDHRATLETDRNGAYRLESSMPGAYGGGSPHLQLRASADGHRLGRLP